MKRRLRESPNGPRDVGLDRASTMVAAAFAAFATRDVIGLRRGSVQLAAGPPFRNTDIEALLV